MTAPALTIPSKVLRSSTAGRRPGDGTFRALTDGELFLNTVDLVLCVLNSAGTLMSVPLGNLAQLASPAFTGAPTAPTPTAGDATTKLATTSFVAAAVANLIASAPGALDTLKELADALGDDANFSTTIMSALANRLRADAANGWTPLQQAQAQANLGILSNGVPGLYRNLKITNGSTANSQVAITADYVSLFDATNGSKLVSAVSLTASTGSTGANALDIGSVAANTWYAVWIISNGTTTAGLLSTSATAPTMPSGYSYRARFGWVRTDGSGNLLRTLQLGNEAAYVVTPSTNTATYPVASSGVQGSTSVPTWVAVAMGGFVPPTASRVDVIMSVYPGYTSMVAPNNSFAGYGNYSNPPPITASNAGNLRTPFSIMLESTNLYTATDNASNALFIRGWKDNI